MEQPAGTGQVLGAPAIGEETRLRWLPAPRGEKASLSRLIERARRLQEKGTDIRRLRQYVERWVTCHRSGLRGLIDKRSRFSQFWNYVTLVLKLN